MGRGGQFQVDLKTFPSVVDFPGAGFQVEKKGGGGISRFGKNIHPWFKHKGNCITRNTILYASDLRS